jgi:hypothetical protein
VDYYYSDRDYQPKGPASLEQLRALAGSGAVNAETLIVPVGSQQWVPITTLLPSLPPSPATEPLAICSLILSVAGLVFCALITSIPGIICGHVALSHIAKRPHLEGKGMAIAGLIIGYAGIALGLAYLVFVIVLVATGAANETAK